MPPTAGASRPAFETVPALSPEFSFGQRDYVVRCRNRPVNTAVTLPAGWKASVASGRFRDRSFKARISLVSDLSYTVTFKKPSGREANFSIRCLPPDFPRYRVTVKKRGAPRLTLVLMENHYAVAFDAGGAPVWWFRHLADPGNPQFLRSGNLGLIVVRNLRFQRFEVRDLSGKLIRKLLPRGPVTSDSHDLLQLPGGNFLFGTHREVRTDTSGLGGEVDSAVSTAQIQEVRPNGKLVWKWNSFPRIRPAQSGRWWSYIPNWGQPYDQTHWNSVDRKGRFILLSFRHLDAVYKVDRHTGKIVWKLGGTKTPRSLRVKGDPWGEYPFGGQHDARFMPDGSITVFDNQTYVEGRPPRAVRYRIDEHRRTATLIRQITDRRFEISNAFGSARVGPNGTWLICWGATGESGTVAAYDREGRPFYRIFTPGVKPYRANPVFGPKPTLEQIRRAMNRKHRAEIGRGHRNSG